MNNIYSLNHILFFKSEYSIFLFEINSKIDPEIQVLCWNENEPLPKVLPQKISQLEFGSKYNQSLTKNWNQR